MSKIATTLMKTSGESCPIKIWNDKSLVSMKKKLDMFIYHLCTINSDTLSVLLPIPCLPTYHCVINGSIIFTRFTFMRDVVVSTTHGR